MGSFLIGTGVTLVTFYIAMIYGSIAIGLIGFAELVLMLLACLYLLIYCRHITAVDREAEYARRLQLATAGKYKWEKFLAWYFGCSEEKAAEMIPEAAPLFGGDSNVDTGVL